MSGNFDDLIGIIKTDKSASFEEMDEAIAEGVVERFNQAVGSFQTSWQETMRGEYYPIETLWDDIDFKNKEE